MESKSNGRITKGHKKILGCDETVLSSYWSDGFTYVKSIKFGTLCMYKFL